MIAHPNRLSNIDMLRGLVIIVMAIDHVRDYFMINMTIDPMADPDVSLSLYLTRWVTHFCAPVFVFLAGTSAGLMAERKSSKQLGSFLFKRGLWIIFIEIAIISSIYSLSPIAGVAQLGGHTAIGLQVLWAIGASMIVLAALQFLGYKNCLIIGLVIVVGHNLLDSIWPVGRIQNSADPIWYGLHSRAGILIGNVHFAVLYPLIPWIGVMTTGFGAAALLKQQPAKRDPLLLKIGTLMTVTFFIIRGIGIYGDPNIWQVQDAGITATLLDFMNVTKYPPSFLFVLITLGPMAILLSYADKFNGWLKDVLVMFGRVPFMFYVAHFCLIRILSILLAWYQGFEFSQMKTMFFFFPKGYGVELIGVYIVWLLLIIILYPLCNWFARLKATRKDWWLSYL